MFFFYDNGYKQRIVDDMGFEDLCLALFYFDRYCSCKDIHEKYSNFFKNYKYSYSDVLYLPPNENVDKLSYRERKELLYKNHNDVIEYIKDFYTSPINDLVPKYIFLDKILIDNNGIIRNKGYKCEWHATALAQRGVADAQFALGINILSELEYRYIVPSFSGTKKEFDEKKFECDINWLKYAGKLGKTRAYHVLGLAAKRTGNLRASMDWFIEGADCGEPKCMFELGEIARKELKDYKVALQWYVKASELGDYMATKYCAELFSINTNNTQANYEEAIYYYTKLIEMEEKYKNRFYENRINSYKKEIDKIKLKQDE